VKEILYDWGGANIWLFRAINGWHNDALDAAMRFASFLGDHERFPLYLAMLAFIAWWRVARGADARRWLGVLTVFSIAYVLDGVVVSWLKHTLDFPRPPATLPPEAVHVVGVAEYRHSLPSGHTLFAATCAASLWPLWGRSARIAVACFVGWVALSRVSLGMHFPADALAGLLLALAIVVGVRRALDALAARWAPAQSGAVTRMRRALSSRRHKR